MPSSSNFFLNYVLTKVSNASAAYKCLVCLTHASNNSTQCSVRAIASGCQTTRSEGNDSAPLCGISHN